MKKTQSLVAVTVDSQLCNCQKRNPVNFVVKRVAIIGGSSIVARILSEEKLSRVSTVEKDSKFLQNKKENFVLMLVISITGLVVYIMNNRNEMYYALNLAIVNMFLEKRKITKKEHYNETILNPKISASNSFITGEMTCYYGRKE
jgi:hypothetical protein